MSNPGQGHLAMYQLGKNWDAVLAGTAGQQRFPDHLAKESARIEVFGGRQVFKGAWQRFTLNLRPVRLALRHKYVAECTHSPP